MPIVVTYLGGSTEVYIPHAGRTCRRGESVEVEDHVAGTEPGDWHVPAADETVPDGWHRRVNDLGDLEVQDPGSGLLAQTDTWSRARRPAPTFTPPAPAGAVTTQEG